LCYNLITFGQTSGFFGPIWTLPGFIFTITVLHVADMVIYGLMQSYAAWYGNDWVIPIEQSRESAASGMDACMHLYTHSASWV